jgi:hypothetical protein
MTGIGFSVLTLPLEAILQDLNDFRTFKDFYHECYASGILLSHTPVCQNNNLYRYASAADNKSRPADIGSPLHNPRHPADRNH